MQYQICWEDSAVIAIEWPLERLHGVETRCKGPQMQNLLTGDSKLKPILGIPNNLKTQTNETKPELTDKEGSTRHLGQEPAISLD